MCLNTDMKFEVYHMLSTGFHLIRVVFYDCFVCCIFLLLLLLFDLVVLILCGFLLLLVEFVVF